MRSNPVVALAVLAAMLAGSAVEGLWSLFYALAAAAVVVVAGLTWRAAWEAGHRARTQEYSDEKRWELERQQPLRYRPRGRR